MTGVNRSSDGRVTSATATKTRVNARSWIRLIIIVAMIEPLGSRSRNARMPNSRGSSSARTGDRLFSPTAAFSIRKRRNALTRSVVQSTRQRMALT